MPLVRAGEADAGCITEMQNAWDPDRAAPHTAALLHVAVACLHLRPSLHMRPTICVLIHAGTPNKPEIVRVDEPLNNTASQFTVYFNRPAVDNLM